MEGFFVLPVGLGIVETHLGGVIQTPLDKGRSVQADGFQLHQEFLVAAGLLQERVHPGWSSIAKVEPEDEVPAEEAKESKEKTKVLLFLAYLISVIVLLLVLALASFRTPSSENDKRPLIIDENVIRYK